MSGALITMLYAAPGTMLSMLLAWPAAQFFDRNRPGGAARRRNACARRLSGFRLARRTGGQRARISTC